MKITCSPIASNKTTVVSVEQDVIIIDGQRIDLSVIPVGGEAIPEDDSPFIGKVKRDEVTIKYYYDSSKAEPDQSTEWEDYTFIVTEGDVPCPIQWKPEPEVNDIVEPEVIEEEGNV